MNIAVYCSSTLGSDASYAAAAVELGRWMGKCGHTLVYGGGDAGLMGIISKEVFEAGCTVIGVVPTDVGFISNREQPYCTEVIRTGSMSERKRKMMDLADVFIALPGGPGTLDEITEAIDLTKVGVFNKKSVLFNRSGYYEPLKQMYLMMEKAGYSGVMGLNTVLFSDDISEIEAFLTKA